MATLSVHLIVADPAAAADWYQRVLGAVEARRLHLPDGSLLTVETTVGDTALAVAGEFPAAGLVSPLALGGPYGAVHVAVDDADAVYGRVIAAGAREVEAMNDAVWGDRTGQFVDPFGHRWAVDTHQRDVPDDEIERALAERFG